MNETTIEEETIKKMKELFGWEIPVESVPLPSNGLLYDPNSILYNRETVQIKSMTAKEEDIITSNAYIKEGVMINKLVSSCLVDKNIDVDDLIIGDRDAILASIRIVSYGSNYDVSHNCNSCGHKNKISANLTNVGIKRLNIEPVSPGKNLFSYTLPVMNIPVLFKFITAKDEIEQRKTIKNMEKLGIKSESDSDITNFLKMCIVQVADNKNGQDINFFIENMHANDSKALRKFINNHQPGLDTNYSYNCEKCQSESSFRLPFNENFFWPNT